MRVQQEISTGRACVATSLRRNGFLRSFMREVLSLLALLVGRDLVSLRRLYELRLQYQSVPKFLLRAHLSLDSGLSQRSFLIKPTVNPKKEMPRPATRDSACLPLLSSVAFAWGQAGTNLG